MDCAAIDLIFEMFGSLPFSHWASFSSSYSFICAPSAFDAHTIARYRSPASSFVSSTGPGSIVGVGDGVTVGVGVLASVDVDVVHPVNRRTAAVIAATGSRRCRLMLHERIGGLRRRAPQRRPAGDRHVNGGSRVH